jgi:hypothetical protein
MNPYQKHQPISIGVCKARHPGKERRDPEAMDGNAKLRDKSCFYVIGLLNQQFLSRTKSVFEYILSASLCSGFTMYILVHCPPGQCKAAVLPICPLSLPE